MNRPFIFSLIAAIALTGVGCTNSARDSDTDTSDRDVFINDIV
ncbi:MAG: hypothetical protein AAB448_00805 [Patescibacteria group bacterium]